MGALPGRLHQDAAEPVEDHRPLPAVDGVQGGAECGGAGPKASHHHGDSAEELGGRLDGACHCCHRRGR